MMPVRVRLEPAASRSRVKSQRVSIYLVVMLNSFPFMTFWRSWYFRISEINQQKLDAVFFFSEKMSPTSSNPFRILQLVAFGMVDDGN